MEISEIRINILSLQTTSKVSAHGSTICATQSIQECQWRGSKLSMLGMGHKSEAQWSCTFFPALLLESREKRWLEFVVLCGFFAVLLSLHSPDVAGCFGSDTVLLAGLNKGTVSKEILPNASSISPRFSPKGGLF